VNTEPPDEARQAEDAASGAPARLVEEHLGLAYYLARRFANRGEPYEEVAQVAALALVKAASRFDAERGVAFSTFAATTIIGELRRHFRDATRSIRLPRRLQERSRDVALAVDSLSQELGRSPTIREVAGACQADEGDVIEVLEADRSQRLMSLDDAGPSHEGDSGEPLGERLGAEDEAFRLVEERFTLSPQINRLPRREQVVLHLRFVEELSQSEIAQRTGVSQMAVSRLLARALTSLRAVHGAEDT
jgi:RNA polymerase sigma-B factor